MQQSKLQVEIKVEREPALAKKERKERLFIVKSRLTELDK